MFGAEEEEGVMMSNVANLERIALWADALEDPTLVQGRGRLARRVGDPPVWEQCCLDVACQVALANGLKNLRVDTDITGDDTRVYKWTTLGNREMSESTVLPMPVCEWFGFDEADPDFLLNRELLAETVSASQANDNYQWPFTKIAKAIRFTWLNGEPYTQAGEDADSDL